LTSRLCHARAIRTEPWFGSFDVEYLADLSLADGTRLLPSLAVERGDDDDPVPRACELSGAQGCAHQIAEFPVADDGFILRP
jgi:hypothetical protein